MAYRHDDKLLGEIEDLNNEMQAWLAKQAGSLEKAMDEEPWATAYRIHNEIDSRMVDLAEDEDAQAN